MAVIKRVLVINPQHCIKCKTDVRPGEIAVKDSSNKRFGTVYFHADGCPKK